MSNTDNQITVYTSGAIFRPNDSQPTILQPSEVDVSSLSITPCLKAKLPDITKGVGKGKEIISRYAVMYSDYPNYIWVHVHGTRAENRGQPSYFLTSVLPDGIQELQDSLLPELDKTPKPGNNDVDIFEGLDSSDIYDAIFGRYDSSYLMAKGYINRNAMLSSIQSVIEVTEYRKSIVKSALEAGVTPKQLKAMGQDEQASWLLNPEYQPQIKPEVKPEVTEPKENITVPLSDSIPFDAVDITAENVDNGEVTLTEEQLEELTQPSS